MKLKALTIMLAVVLLAPAAAFSMASFDFPVVAPVISIVQGDVTVKGTGGSDWENAEVGRLLASGDTVKTGPSSRAEISCATGKMRLYENTVIIVPEVVDEGEKRDVRKVQLDDGTGLFRIKKRGVERGFEVQTSNVIAGVKGTLFAVQHDKGRKVSRVAVFSGVVEVTDTNRSPGSKTKLGRGKSMEVEDQKGFGETDSFEPGDPWGDWSKTDSLDFGSLGTGTRDPLGLTVEGGDEPECDPVTNPDGSPIYY